MHDWASGALNIRLLHWIPHTLWACDALNKPMASDVLNASPSPRIQA